jgi:hypothetical protein
MGIATAQCKCVSGAPGRPAVRFDIIHCDIGRMLPSANTQPAGVGRRRGAGVPWGPRRGSERFRVGEV